MYTIKGQKHMDTLIEKRDRIRNEFIDKQNKTSEKYDSLYNKAQKQAKEYTYYLLYSIVGWIIIFLTLYKRLYTIYVKIVLIILVGIVIFLLVKTIKYHIERLSIYKQWQLDNQNNDKLKQTAIIINKEIAQIGIMIICYSENYYQLRYNDNYKKIWHLLINQYIDAIQEEFDNKATVDDFITYYQKWKQKIIT